jgi:hypothetical protein
MSIFTSMWNWVQKELTLLWADIGPAFTSFVTTVIDGGGRILLEAAGQAIAQVAADPSLVNNSDKRNAAISKLLESMAAQGIALAETAALNAVQVAYSNIKNGLNADGSKP